MPKLTLRAAQAEARLFGCTLIHHDGEYKVRVKGSPVGEGYFTNDLDDALTTARIMSEPDDRVRQALGN
jgi:hypothetical protein